MAGAQAQCNVPDIQPPSLRRRVSVQLGGVLYEPWGDRTPGWRPMIFNSLTFLVFFGLVMALHYAPFF